jgi:cytochrome subunit of sulfide dehydrogenase
MVCNRPRTRGLAAGLLWIALAAGPAAAQDALLARNLAASCANCHGPGGQARGEMPVLAGMPADRLLTSIAEFKSGARPATVMHQIARGYTDQQMQLIAGYFAAQKK